MNLNQQVEREYTVFISVQIKAVWESCVHENEI